MATEEPNYTILNQTEDFELRRYDAQLVAQTWVTGDQDAASRQGFKILADYIFGNNTALSGDSSKISMTAPVMMQPQTVNENNNPDSNGTDSNDTDNAEQSKKIAMTAPVMIQQLQEAQQDNGKWRVQFIMPSHYTMQTLPKPNNSDITITELPVKTYGVIQFSGLAGNNRVVDKTETLRTWMQSQKLTITGTSELARYNPPWILPFMRRNEVMIPYQQK
ncbi:SOUL family heme-binding protein [Psychrobacter urativorans]|uniref:SOUL family heme-binding protein n=1 Tax=Psychrobacter urativorans TaxID=45610 RepID=UPI00191A9FD7|nr:heme-binding protein [Psychrobacter urativorans]